MTRSSPGSAEAGALVNSAYDELCVRFSGVHSDDAMDSVLLRLHAALKKMGIDPTAPYIAPDLSAVAATRQDPAMWVCFSDNGQFIRAWTKDAARAALFHEEGLDINPLYAGPAQASWLPDLQFLLDRLEEFDPGDDEPEREFHGHVTPAIARLRSALSSTNRGGEA